MKENLLYEFWGSLQGTVMCLYLLGLFSTNLQFNNRTETTLSIITHSKRDWVPGQCLHEASHKMTETELIPAAFRNGLWEQVCKLPLPPPCHNPSSYTQRLPCELAHLKKISKAKMDDAQVLRGCQWCAKHCCSSGHFHPLFSLFIPSPLITLEWIKVFILRDNEISDPKNLSSLSPYQDEFLHHLSYPRWWPDSHFQSQCFKWKNSKVNQ